MKNGKTTFFHPKLIQLFESKMEKENKLRFSKVIYSPDTKTSDQIFEAIEKEKIWLDLENPEYQFDDITKPRTGANGELIYTLIYAKK